MKPEIDWTNPSYDFIDFGSKIGGSMDLAIRRLGGTRGLGIDIRPDVVEKAQQAGYDVILGDATKLEFPENCVRFAVISHFLEHLPDLETVKKSLKSAIKISREFIYIRGPVFDDEEYLKSLGFRTYWSHWIGHPCHLTTFQLADILKSLGQDNFEFRFEVPMYDSKSKNIHPLSAPDGQHEYDAKLHPPKPYVKFDHVIFREFVCNVFLNKK